MKRDAPELSEDKVWGPVKLQPATSSDVFLPVLLDLSHPKFPCNIQGGVSINHVLVVGRLAAKANRRVLA
jgi:hypothetical protein